MFANGSEDQGSIPGRVTQKIQKIVLDATLLNTQHYKVQIKDKVDQSRERISTPLHHGVLGIEKVAFELPTTVANFTFTFFKEIFYVARMFYCLIKTFVPYLLLVNLQLDKNHKWISSKCINPIIFTNSKMQNTQTDF